MEKIDLSKVSASELEEILKRKKQEEHDAKVVKREAYEGIRAEVVQRIKEKVRAVTEEVSGLYCFVKDETTAFYDVMLEYGRLRRDGQMSYTLVEGDFKIEVKSNKVKKFDERADVAASKLVRFLRGWIGEKERGESDPMYQLAMTLLERNKYGDLDYKSVSKLYDLEERFNDTEYSEIMNLFKESNVTESTAVNYYFYEKTDMGVWRKIEPSFNRM
jgi:hypothetical protein